MTGRDTGTVRITIRRVPRGVRNELASRAAHEGKSMQRYLLDLLEETVARPTMAEVTERIRKRKRAAGSHVSVAAILEARDAGREERWEAARPRSRGGGVGTPMTPEPVSSGRATGPAA